MRFFSEPVVHAGAGPRDGNAGVLGDAQYRAIFEASRDALLVADARTGMLLDANPAAVALLGHSLEEFRAMHQSAVHSEEDLDAGRNTFQERRYRSGANEHTLVRADGARIPVEISASPMRGPQGQEWVLGIFHDLTERAEADRALRASEEKFRQITEHIRDVFWIVPPNLDELLRPGDGESFYVSPAYEQVWGRTRESLYADPAAWLNAIHPEDVERAHVLFNPPEPVDTEFRILTPEGQVKWIRDRAFPIRAHDGSLIRVTGIAEDITERKNYEAALILAREQAEAASRTKSMFLAAMSHELRTPLNAILGFAELLSLDMADRGIHEWDEDLQKIRRAGNHLLSVISDVLDFSKIEADRIELVPETFDVQALLNDVIASFDAIVRKNEIDLQTECEPAALSLDRTRVGQCLFNLVGNACKFTQKGRVRVQGAWERTGDQEFYAISVADTGIGIQPRDLEQLFQYFTQVDNSRKRKYGGTGLGSAISRRLARLMGGDITAESKFGAGSRFTIRLPKHLSPAATETSPDESAG